MTTSKTTLLSQLLNCWYSDIQFLIKICEQNEIDLDIEDIKDNYWEIKDVNILIYVAIEEISKKFLEEYKDQIEEALNLRNLESYLSENDDIYEIFTNYIDSHLWFKNDKIQSIFESSKFYF
jgi:hypothetical protein